MNLDEVALRLANRYVDEVIYEAGEHPKRTSKKNLLTDFREWSEVVFASGILARNQKEQKDVILNRKLIERKAEGNVLKLIKQEMTVV